MNLEKILLEKMSLKKRFLWRILHSVPEFRVHIGYYMGHKMGCFFPMVVVFILPRNSEQRTNGKTHPTSYLMTKWCSPMINSGFLCSHWYLRKLLKTRILFNRFCLSWIRIFMKLSVLNEISKGQSRSVPWLYCYVIIPYLICLVLMNWSNVSAFIRMKLCRLQFRGWRF